MGLNDPIKEDKTPKPSLLPPLSFGKAIRCKKRSYFINRWRRESVEPGNQAAEMQTSWLGSLTPRSYLKEDARLEMPWECRRNWSGAREKRRGSLVRLFSSLWFRWSSRWIVKHSSTKLIFSRQASSELRRLLCKGESRKPYNHIEPTSMLFQLGCFICFLDLFLLWFCRIRVLTRWILIKVSSLFFFIFRLVLQSIVLLSMDKEFLIAIS